MNYSRIVPALFIWSILTATASGQTKPPAQEPPRNIIYGELAGGLILTQGSINYERCIGDHFGVRVGAGLGYMFSNGFHGSGGGLLMLNYFTLGKGPRLEIGAGLSYSLPNNDAVITPINPTPSFSFGARFQDADDGTFSRFGATYGFRFGFPLQLSIGTMF
ncbi:MAG: hypothetical protein ABIR47_14505 [Candidatus Kapaibacterium sp.]